MNEVRLHRILARLDALAENPGTSWEGENARQKAAELRKKHGVQPPMTERERRQFALNVAMGAMGIRFTDVSEMVRRQSGGQ